MVFEERNGRALLLAGVWKVRRMLRNRQRKRRLCLCEEGVKQITGLFGNWKLESEICKRKMAQCELRIIIIQH